MDIHKKRPLTPSVAVACQAQFLILFNMIRSKIRDPVRVTIRDLICDPICDPICGPIHDPVRDPIRDVIRSDPDFVKVNSLKVILGHVRTF